MLSALDALGTGSREILIMGLLMGGGMMLMGILLSWRDKSALLRTVAGGLVIILLTLAAVFLIPEDILWPSAIAAALIWGGVMSLLAIRWYWEGASIEPKSSLGARLFGIQNLREMRRATWGIAGTLSILIGIVMIIVLVVKLMTTNGQ